MRRNPRLRPALLPGAVLGIVLALVLASCGGGDGEPKVIAPRDRPRETTGGGEATSAAWPGVTLEEVYAGFDQPLQVASAMDGSGRLFVVEKGGRVRVARDGGIDREPFLDISEKVSGGSEQGLLCVAFPAGFGNGKDSFYVNYTDRDGDTVVARYRASDGGRGRADASSEEVILRIDQPFPNHNGGQLLFDEEGYLLIGTGDGGSAGDPRGNAQDRTSLLGKLLRIDVGERDAAGPRPASHSLPGPEGSAYRIPGDNPYARHERFRGEIWAYGLRNPWRFSIDAETGDLYIGDVGQDDWEEIDAVRGLGEPASDYGWNLLEATHPYPPGSEPPEDLERFVMPVVEYGRDLGGSVTGGVVYRGWRQTELRGIYFYADYLSGRLWGLRDALGEPETRRLADTEYAISSFGTDGQGEVYVTDLTGGRVLRVTAD